MEWCGIGPNWRVAHVAPDLLRELRIFPRATAQITRNVDPPLPLAQLRKKREKDYVCLF